MATTPAAAPSRAGIGFALGTVVSFQVGAVLAVKLLEQVGPVASMGLRTLIAGPIALALWRPTLRGRSAADIRLVVAYGIALGLSSLTLYEAFDRLPVGVAITLIMSGPLMVTVLQRAGARDLVWAAVAMAGVVLLVRPSGNGAELVGVAFGIGAAVASAVYVVLGARVTRIFPGAHGVSIGLVVAALTIGLPGVAAHAWHLDAGDVAFGALLAVVAAVIPHSCELAALKRVPARVFGVLMALQPVVAAGLALVLLGQGLSALSVVGIALVVGAAVAISAGAR
jgi:inner membrane transporter RhtA